MDIEDKKAYNREYMRARRADPGYRETQKRLYQEWYAANGRNRNDGYNEIILEWQHEHPDRVIAMKALQYAVKTGKIIKPSSCQDCGRVARLSGHHTDYSKHYEVIWLCSSCHKLRHSPVGLDKPKDKGYNSVEEVIEGDVIDETENNK